MLKRPRRNRKSESTRMLCQETVLLPSDLIMPFFVLEGENREENISQFPGILRLTADKVVQKARTLHKKGVQAIALFPVVPADEKSDDAKYALDPDGIIPKALKLIKKELPNLSIVTDIALDPFTLHSHDGILNKDGDVDNDKTVEILQKMAVLHGRYGADFVAPSATMDGRTAALRRGLDKANLPNVGIVAYTAKYGSCLYSPFRDALSSGLKRGNKLTYQLHPANQKQALREAELDEEGGADVLMVKPALYYLDIIAKFKESSSLPIAAYHVSGEYAMVMAAHEAGYLDARKTFLEALISIKRAGADMIFTYATEIVLDTIIASPLAIH